MNHLLASTYAYDAQELKDLSEDIEFQIPSLIAIKRLKIFENILATKSNKNEIDKTQSPVKLDQSTARSSPLSPMKTECDYYRNKEFLEARARKNYLDSINVKIFKISRYAKNEKIFKIHRYKFLEANDSRHELSFKA